MGPPVGGCMTSCRDHGTEKSGYYPRPGIDESQSMDLQEQPLVSVVTPVYNGEKYLIECIESVLAQTYRNWEYIIVNNCSTDRSFDIAQSYAQHDARIRIHNNREFVAVIQNHNVAFRQISPQSRFCKIVHADDWLFPECIRLMVELATANPSVGIVGSYSLYDMRVECDRLPYPSTVVSGRELCRSTLLGDLYLFLSPTCLLIRSDLIRNREPFYNEAHLHADVEAYYEILQCSDFGFVHQVLTYIRRHDESMTSSFAHQLNTIILSNLDLLVRYGPIYLSDNEYRRRLKHEMSEYYRFLANNIFRLRERERFWNYHRKGLEEMGHPLSKIKLIKALSLEAFSTILHPRRTIKDIFRYVSFKEGK